MHAECFLDDSVQVGEFRNSSDGDVLRIAPKRASNLPNQPLHLRRMLQGKVRRSCQRRSGRLTSSKHKQGSGRVDVLASHAAGVVVFKNVFHEVLTVGLRGDALVDLLPRPGVVAHGDFFDLRGNEVGNEGVERGKMVEDGENLGEFDAGVYGCDLFR